MSFSDVLKKSFWEGISSSNFTTKDIILVFLIAGLLGLYIYGIYRVTTRKSFYSKSFNASLVIMTLITAAIIVTIQSSVVISLGMVGALSIVRFRTAIKDPMDLVFLFWSISIGIICGAGLFKIAVLLSAAVSVLILMLELMPVSRPPMILVINADKMEAEDAFIDVVRAYTKHYKIKSRNMTKQGLDLVIELRIKDGGELVRNLGSIASVQAVSLLSHDGEVTF